MSERSDVRNAADPAQVRRAARRQKRRAMQGEDAARGVLSTPAGRAFCWDILTRCGVYRSIYVPNSGIYYNAGRQDLGHELQALLLSADEGGYEAMEREARARAKAERDETDAGHTARATTEEDQR